METVVIIFTILFFAIGWFFATGFGKGQYIRILDIVLYGPYLIYLGFKNTYTFAPWEKIFLLFLGSTTITYNLRNFIGGF